MCIEYFTNMRLDQELSPMRRPILASRAPPPPPPIHSELDPWGDHEDEGGPSGGGPLFGGAYDTEEEPSVPLRAGSDSLRGGSDEENQEISATPRCAFVHFKSQ